MDPSQFSTAFDFHRDGLYLYKRPVRSASNQAALLAAAGSVFHHCVVYVKAGDKVSWQSIQPCRNACHGLESSVEAGV